MFVQSDRHVASYYAGTYPAPIPHRPELDERIDADVLVVGAGFSGLHTALQLALAGKRVVVLEASRVAWAASGQRRAGAARLVVRHAAARFARPRRRRLLWDSMRWAAAEVRELPVRHGFDIDYRPGSLWAAVRPRRVAMLEQARDEAAERWGYDRLRVIGRDEMPEWIGGTRYLAALHDPEAGHLNPLKLALGLAQTIERTGAASSSRAACSTAARRPAALPARRAAKCARTCSCWPATRMSTGSIAISRAGCCRSARRSRPRRSHRRRPFAAAAEQLRDRQPVRARLFPPEADNRLLFGGGCVSRRDSGRYRGGDARTSNGCSRSWPACRSITRGAAISTSACAAHRTSAATGSVSGCRGSRGTACCRRSPCARGGRRGARRRTPARAVPAHPQPALPGGDRLAAPLEAIGKACRLRDTV